MSANAAAELSPYVAWSAFALAFVFGAVGNKTNFCTMGAVSDWVNMGDRNRMRMWLLAIGVAILGANGLHLAGFIDLSKSIYQGPNFTWLSYAAGGFFFGVGMTLGSGCGSITLIRIGAGNLKSVVVFVFIAIAAFMTLRGILAAMTALAIALFIGPSMIAWLSRYQIGQRVRTDGRRAADWNGRRHHRGPHDDAVAVRHRRHGHRAELGRVRVLRRR